jgi:hypothetical protein
MAAVEVGLLGHEECVGAADAVDEDELRVSLPGGLVVERDRPMGEVGMAYLFVGLVN